jgi:hypothetical protein
MGTTREKTKLFKTLSHKPLSLLSRQSEKKAEPLVEKATEGRSKDSTS